MRRLLAVALCAALITGLSSCGQEEGTSSEFYAMDTNMSVTAYDGNAQDAVSAVRDELYSLDLRLSRTRIDSAISRLNTGVGLPAEEADISQLITSAIEYSDATAGAFDITVAPLVSAWGFTTDHYQIPKQKELDRLLPHVGSSHILFGGDGTITLDGGTKIDLGGIAKGYASDLCEGILSESGVTSAMVSLGGNIYVRGSKPDGSAWRVGVQDPKKPSGFAGVLSLTDAYAVTSGGYQRYFEENGKRYHHILNPATGYPAESGLTSVTVVAPANGDEHGNGPGHGTMCDAFSTALFVMGEEKAVEFWRSGVYDFDLVMVTEDGRVLVTDGLADKFQQEDGSGYAYETVSGNPA
ncbi:FAD:protein FMN transferase [uncultured Oscillibacter sp.]|uniref:FAD:protein FMN transferase n=1 Tax=uncultured Oscillibacter sp. TaxID=876091 RepID=UPI0025D88142|nr:FAD:protein FMN transferase [uncultured Oscillibacter sp.]